VGLLVSSWCGSQKKKRFLLLRPLVFGNLVFESSVSAGAGLLLNLLSLQAVGPFVLIQTFDLVDLIRALRTNLCVEEAGSSPEERAKEGKDARSYDQATTSSPGDRRFLDRDSSSRRGATGGTRLWNDDIELLLVSKIPDEVHQIAFAYFTAGMYDKALGAAQKAIELDATYAHAYHTQSLVYERWGEKEKAIALAKKSFELDPEFHIAHYTLELSRRAPI
jgi:tetratricopeptide (TPR) repeat protein